MSYPFDFKAPIVHEKLLANLTPDLENCLKDIAPIVIPHLRLVTDNVYIKLLSIPATSRFLASYMDKLDELKTQHLSWIISLFVRNIDADFAQDMRKIGEAYVTVQLPLEFMTSAMSLINAELSKVVLDTIGDDKARCLTALQAINAVTSLSLILMQKSYQLWDAYEQNDISFYCDFEKQFTPVQILY
jgi:hypothetical protein